MAERCETASAVQNTAKSDREYGAEERLRFVGREKEPQRRAVGVTSRNPQTSVDYNRLLQAIADYRTPRTIAGGSGLDCLYVLESE